MIDVSNEWKDIQQRFLLPETFVEIDCTISEVGSEAGATATGTAEAVFSDTRNIVTDVSKSTRYATNELNLWALDGTRTILPSSAPYGSAGYVSNVAATGSITLSFPAVRTVASSGITITWSKLYDEYPTVFTVTAKNGEVKVAETTITDNKDQVSAVFLSLQNYDTIEVTIHDWSLPNRRARIEKVVIGHVLTFTKNDIITFKHEQNGDLLSGELPKYSIEFTLDNTDGRWNPLNPTGMEQYLSERQKLVVRYGMDVNGTVEWIRGGVFYLSEWDAPANGLEARFVARDVFEYLINVDMAGSRYDTLEGLIETAVAYNLPDDVVVSIDPALGNFSGIVDNGENTAAEMVQKSANAGMRIMRYGRDGVLHIEALSTYLTEYTITAALSYTHPEITLSKPLKKVSIGYGGESPYELDVFFSGEVQTVNNDFINSRSHAEQVAAWVRDILVSRKTVSGEFRADPRVDLYDVVRVESKYGVLEPVVLTNITYTYNGSFRGSYTGRVLEG